MENKSYFMQEVTTIKDFVDESGHGNHLFLLDELFRGTNTKERIAISKAVLSWLVKSDNLVFVSTHDLELADMLEDEYELYYFSESVKDGILSFDYMHLIGKDIIRFHTIYWPIFLMALGEPLPKQVFGHPWLLMGGGKMSKSKGNVVYADDLVDYFGVDAVRYYVLHEMPFENDGNLTWELVAERTNSDLANTLGNLVNRTISMSNKYFGGVVENRNVQLTENDAAVDADLKQTVTGTYAKVVAKMEELRVADALTEIFGIFKRCNKYIDETEPWVLAKDEAKADRLATVLYNLVEGIIIGASLLEPYMPETAEKIAKQLNTSLRDFDQLEQFSNTITEPSTGT